MTAGSAGAPARARWLLPAAGPAGAIALVLLAFGAHVLADGTRPTWPHDVHAAEAFGSGH